MLQSARSRKIGAVVALVISWWAAYWLLSISHDFHPPSLSRFGLVAALFCALGGFTFFFAACLAFIGKKRKWSPWMCHMAGLLIVLPTLFFGFADTRSGVVTLVAMVPFFSGHVCGKLVHPELTDEEAYAPEPPLTLFPK